MSSVQSTPPEPLFKVAERAPEGIVLADSAAARLARLSDVEGASVILRVAVDGGGCSGFQYRFELIAEPDADDLIVRNGDRLMVIDQVSIPFLTGSEVAWVDDLSGAQFVVRNPNAASSCGCGVSFSI